MKELNRGSVLIDIPPECEAVAESMNGKTYQVHVQPNGKLRLYTVTSLKIQTRCLTVVGGEQCGGTQGHEGKHWWSGGD
jgi:hypothetical protein